MKKRVTESRCARTGRDRTLAFGITIANPLVWATTIVGVAVLMVVWRPAVTAVRADTLILQRDE